MLVHPSNTTYQETLMQQTHTHTTMFKPILCGVLVGLACALTTPPAHANENELRAGAVLQVPFSLGSSFPSFDPTRIRLGLTAQYANIESDEITTTRTIDISQTPNLVLTTTVQEDTGSQVLGLEGNIFIEPFNNFNGSAELLGLYGNNDIQGALGGGYSMADGFFIDAKAMFPYSEIGLRLMNQPEIYGGGKTLGSFNPAQNRRLIDIPVTVTPAL